MCCVFLVRNQTTNPEINLILSCLTSPVHRRRRWPLSVTWQTGQTVPGKQQSDILGWNKPGFAKTVSRGTSKEGRCDRRCAQVEQTDTCPPFKQTFWRLMPKDGWRLRLHLGVSRQRSGGHGAPDRLPLGRGLNKYGRQKEKQSRDGERPVTGRCVAAQRGIVAAMRGQCPAPAPNTRHTSWPAITSTATTIPARCSHTHTITHTRLPTQPQWHV